MVDWYGRWKPEKDYSDYPTELMCDCDRIAKRIMEDGYKPKTSIENVVMMVFAYFDASDIESEGYERYTLSGDFNIEECVRYVKDSGDWKEFDWEDE